MPEPKTTTIQTTTTLHDRLEGSGRKSETFEDIIVRFIEESDYKPKVKAELEKVLDEVEKGKQHGRLPLTIADVLCRLLKEWIEDIEAR